MSESLVMIICLDNNYEWDKAKRDIFNHYPESCPGFKRVSSMNGGVGK